MNALIARAVVCLFLTAAPPAALAAFVTYNFVGGAGDNTIQYEYETTFDSASQTSTFTTNNVGKSVISGSLQFTVDTSLFPGASYPGCCAMAFTTVLAPNVAPSWLTSSGSFLGSVFKESIDLTSGQLSGAQALTSYLESGTYQLELWNDYYLDNWTKTYDNQGRLATEHVVGTSQYALLWSPDDKLKIQTIDGVALVTEFGVMLPGGWINQSSEEWTRTYTYDNTGHASYTEYGSGRATIMDIASATVTIVASEVNTVPEPGTKALVALALLTLAKRRRHLFTKNLSGVAIS